MSSLQSNRGIQLVTPLGQDKLLMHRMTAREQLGRPFEIDLDLLAADAELDLDAILGQPATIALETTAGPRYLNGIVSRFTWVGSEGRLARYQVKLVPWLWVLTRTANCRIFQQKTVPDIIKQVFRDNQFTDFQDKLSGTYREWEYCVQYRESDFNFVSRLMENEGIYYYFKHSDGKHELVLSDDYASHASLGTLPYFPPEHGVKVRESIYHWSISREVQTGKYALTDYDFERPKVDLTANSQVSRKHKQAKHEIFDYPGEYIQSNDGTQYVRRRIEELQSRYERVQGVGNTGAVVTGSLFKLGNSPRPESAKAEYLVVSSVLDVQTSEYETGSDGQSSLECRFEALDAKTPYRSTRQTPAPTIQGPQTAMVVGKAGEEIWTDKYGRVKVQFHWDREGKNDENSSCWVRVAQMWAGKTWGAMHIPRIGQEVVVEFLEGDPDRPLITGRVYNADQMPPYKLPANQTQSGIKSRSTKGGTADNFNELRFEDKKGKEHIYFHAERDFERVVENNDTLKVGFDTKDSGDQKIDIFNNQVVNIGASGADDGSQTITILQDQTETVQKGDVTIALEKGSRKTTIHKDDTLTLKTGSQTVKISAGKNLTQAAQSITLKVGGSSIKLDPAGITMKATMIKIQGSAMLDMKAAVAKCSGSGMLQLKGGMTMIN